LKPHAKGVDGIADAHPAAAADALEDLPEFRALLRADADEAPVGFGKLFAHHADRLLAEASQVFVAVELGQLEARLDGFAGGAGWERAKDGHAAKFSHAKAATGIDKVGNSLEKYMIALRRVLPE
jgi:hypothetical protein